MSRLDSLRWNITLKLPLNTQVQYKFVVDGNWFYDVDMPVIRDSKGNTNNIQTVGKSSAPLPAPSFESLPQNIAALQDSIIDAFAALLQALGQSPNRAQIARGIQLSKNAEYEFSFPCYEISKLFKSKPEAVAELLAKKHLDAPSPVFAKLHQGTGDKDRALLNFSVHPQLLAASTIGEFFHPPAPAHSPDTIIVEFSSPNTNKPQHLGHVRNNCLGDAIAKMLRYQGTQVVTINLVNDRGVHICKSMLAYKKFGSGECPESGKVKGDHLVGDYYVKFDVALGKEYGEWLKSGVAQEEFEKWKASSSGKRIVERNEKERKKLEKEPEKLSKIPSDFDSFKSEYKDYYTNKFSPLGIECNQMLVAWENNDPEVRALWTKMNQWVFDGFKQTYALYGISHDVWEKESEIYEYGRDIILQAFEAGLVERLQDGAYAVDLVDIGVLKKGSGEERKKVILRSNGTSVYMTQDIGTALTRMKKYGNEKDLPQMIYVVASEQDRHFQILFKILEQLEPRSKGKYFHRSYGMVLLPTGRMKSREGTVVDADDLAVQLGNLAFEVTMQKWPELSEEEGRFRAEKIGMAALKFYILSFGPETSITFDPTKSLQFSGKSGPYLLYQYARTRSIFKKAGVDISTIKYTTDFFSHLNTEEESDLLRTLYQFPKDVQFACETRDPSKVCDSIYAISQSFNNWYRLKDKHQVVNCTDPDLKTARLLLVLASGNAIKRGLNLLGIETLEQM